jgi:hypothetical protein
MSWEPKTGKAFCERCGHAWTVKSFLSSIDKKEIRVKPKSCARCKNKGWNTPRVYAIGSITGTMAKRYKPTGRAAATLLNKLREPT